MRRLLGILLDQKWWILLVMVLFGLGGLIYSSLMTPVYQGDTMVQVERRSSVNTVGETSSLVQEMDNAGRVATEIQILRSRMVLGRVVDNLGLDMSIESQRLPVIGGYIQQQDVARPDLAGLPLLGDWLMTEEWGESLRDFVLQHPAVWGQEGIEVVRLKMADELQGMPLMITSLDDGYYRLWVEGKVLGTGSQGEEESFMGGRIQLHIKSIEAPSGAEFRLLKRPRDQAIAQLRARLGITEEGANARGVSTGMLRLTLTGSERGEIRKTLDAISQTFLMQNLERQSAEAQQSLEFLETQVPELRDRLAAAEDRMSQYRTNVDSIDLDSEAKSVIDQFISLESQLNGMAIREAEMSQRFTVNHPSYQGLLEKKRYLKAELDRLNHRVNSMPEAQQQVIRLNRDVEVAQAIYVDVLNKTQELQLARAGTIGNVRIIDPAVVGRNPIKPQTSVIIGAAALLGGLLAIIYVLLRGVFSRGIENPQQVEELGIPVYATIPLSPEQVRIGRHHGQESEDGTRLLAQQNSMDSAVEALRSLRTSLHVTMLDAANNCLMICGPSPGIGKSFVTLNLGGVCAQGGQRVLVIDADLRRGSLHSAFGESSKGGLSDVLSGRLGLDEAIRSTDLEGLSYLSRGMAPPNPAELLMTQKFSDLMDEVSGRFDLVILDTPPVLAVTDAAIVGKSAATTLMIARFQMNPPRELKLTMQSLDNAGIEVKGCIINGLQRKSTMAYGYGYYQYQYASKSIQD